MKKIRRRLFLMTLLIAVLCVPAGAAYGYFTCHEDAHGGAVIHLSGQTELIEEADDAGKTAIIRNTGDTNVIVRIQAYSDFISAETPADSDWIKGDDGFWYYKKILMPEGAKVPAGDDASLYQSYETSSIRIDIDTDKAKEAAHDFEIVLVQEATRVVFDGSNKNYVVKPAGWQYPDIAVGMSGEVE